MRGTIKKRSENSYTLIYDAPRGLDGRRKQVWKTFYGTSREAERELTRLVHEAQTGGYTDSQRMTFGQFCQKWIDTIEGTRSAKTLERYEEIIRLHIVPNLGKHKLDGLRPIAIQSYYKEALKSGKKTKQGGGLAPQTVLHHHTLIHKILADAVRWGHIARNPADAVDPPKVERPERQVMEATKVSEALTQIVGTPYEIPVMLAITTGMRRGEILALRWSDIDLESGTLTIVRAVEQTRAGLAYKEPKTKKSRRQLALPASIVARLQLHQAWQEGQGKMVPGYNPEGLVCPNVMGKLMNPNKFSDRWMKIRKEIGINVTFHDLRHSHATMLLLTGVHPKLVSERLGHSTIRTTYDVYSHVVPSMQDELAKQIDKILEGKEGTG